MQKHDCKIIITIEFYIQKTYPVCAERCQQNMQRYFTVSNAIAGFSCILIASVSGGHDSMSIPLEVLPVAKLC